MGKIEVDIDDRIIAGIEMRAKLHDRSLHEEVQAILEGHASLNRTDRLRVMRAARDLTPKSVQQTDSADLIRASRDGDLGHD
ncbi:MAG: hypothetical protein AB7S41_14200 [Parvibaculaceae bacterium]